MNATVIIIVIIIIGRYHHSSVLRCFIEQSEKLYCQLGSLKYGCVFKSVFDINRPTCSLIFNELHVNDNETP